MALSINILPFNRICGPTFGGLARVWLFDPADFDFTQAVPGVGGANPYSAVALATAAAGNAAAKMYPIVFDKKTAEYTFKQSRKGCSVKYEHQLELKLSDLSQLITNWNAALDAAGCCGGLGILMQLNSGKMFVAGERVVNGAPIEIPLDMVQDGSSGSTGKLIDDENAETVILKGDYTRKLYEFTGGVASIMALE